MSIILAIVIVILMVVIHHTWTTYLEELDAWCSEVTWHNHYAKDLLRQLSLKFGPPEPADIEPGGAAIWDRGASDIPVQKIVLTDTSRCLAVSLPLQLLSNFQHVHIDPEGYQQILEDIHKLNNVTYSAKTRNFTVHIDEWHKAIAIITLLIKLSNSQTTLKDIKNRDLIELYNKKCAVAAERYEQKINSYVTQTLKR